MVLPIQTPLSIPTHLNVAPPRELTEEEQTQYDHVLAHFSSPEYVLPGVDSENSALMEVERMWLSYECILRYIRAAKHDVSESIKRLEDTLRWRRDFGLYTSVTAEHVEPEAVTGKEFVFGYDTHGRPALYVSPSKHCTGEDLRQIQFFCWTLERVTEFMGPGVESLTVMADYADGARNPSLSFCRQIIHIVQTHYPERLGTAIFINFPWLFHAFYKLISPFIDTVTRSKIVFNPVRDDAGLWLSTWAGDRDQCQEDAKLFELDQLISESWLGSVPFTYTHEVYWPALLTMTETRRNEMTRVWQDLGGVVGIREWDVKVHIRDSLVAPTTELAG